MSNYNSIASFYDRLAKMIFGNAIKNAQKFLIQAIRPGSTVLIIGGGSGWILEEITKIRSKGIKITYVELSEKMIALSRKRDTGTNEVFFLNESIQDVILDQEFEYVITPFVIDNFSAATAAIVFQKINDLLLPRGIWMFADFQISGKNTLWQRMVLKIMYIFFKAICNIEASQLPDTATLFKKHKYEIVSSETFFADFICSIIYKKQDSPGNFIIP